MNQRITGLFRLHLERFARIQRIGARLDRFGGRIEGCFNDGGIVDMLGRLPNDFLGRLNGCFGGEYYCVNPPSGGIACGLQALNNRGIRCCDLLSMIGSTNALVVLMQPPEGHGEDDGNERGGNPR